MVDVGENSNASFVQQFWVRELTILQQMAIKNADVFLDSHQETRTRVNLMFILDKNHPKMFCGSLACMHACSQTGRFDSMLWRWNMGGYFLFLLNCGEASETSPSFQKPPHLALPVQHLSWDAAEAAECRRMVMLNCLARQLISAQNPHNIALYWSVHKDFTNGLWNSPYTSLGRISFPIYSN